MTFPYFVMSAACACLLSLTGCATTQAPSQHVVRTTGGVVVSVDRYASDIGAAVLRRGGHAVDAAVAVGFALAVTWPEAGNVGGGGFMLVREATGEAIFVDYRETAPAAAGPTYFLDAAGRVDPQRVRLGGWSAGIPGTVAGLAAAHARYGRLPWKSLVEPAVALARDGFIVDDRLTAGLAAQLPELTQFQATRDVFFHGGKTPVAPGERLSQADLARVLETVAKDGPRAFYEGPLASGMVEAMKAAGGSWTAADLAAYRVVIRQPLRFTFRGLSLLAAPPPSSSGVAIGEMLAILDGLAPESLTAGAPQTLHLLAETMRRAFLDRALHLGDPDHVPAVTTDAARLLTPAHAAERRTSIDRGRASRSAALAPPGLLSAPAEGSDTTHFSVVDAAGNAVANTYTIEESFGSKAVLPGYGFLLNNELHDFNVKPGHTDRSGAVGTAPNQVAPGKRPLSSMAPLMVERATTEAGVTRHGELVAVLGSPGGRTIINTVFQVFLNLFVFKLAPEAAVAAPRVHHQWMPDRLFVEREVPTATIEALLGMGHSVERLPRNLGHANTIVREGDRWVGIVDARRGGHAAAAP